MSRRRHRKARLLASAVAPGVLLGYGACGGRTPLDVLDAIDAAADNTVSEATAPPPPAPIDGSFADAPLDVLAPPLEAGPDVSLPPPPDSGPTTCYTHSVLTLATKQDAWSVRLDDQYVYWNNESGELRRVPKQGGTVEVVGTLSQAGMALDFALDSTDVYFAQWDGNDGGPLVRVQKDGGVPTTLASAFYGMGIAIDNTTVYWTEIPGTQDPGTIRSVPKDGGSPSLLATSYPDDPVFVRVDSAYLYYTRWDVSGGVSRIPTQGGSATVLASVPYANDIAVDASDVYFTSQGSSAGVWRVPKQGGTLTQLVQDSQAEDLWLDGLWVYYTDFNNVRKVPKAGGAYVDVAPNQQNVRSIAVDADCAYWSNDPIVGEIRVGPK